VDGVIQVVEGREWAGVGIKAVSVGAVVGCLLVLGGFDGQVDVAGVWAGGSQAYLWPSGTGLPVCLRHDD
jgi:hypothetical protein